MIVLLVRSSFQPESSSFIDLSVGFRLRYYSGSCQKVGVPSHLVSEADWMPGTAGAPVSLSHYSYED